MTRQTPTTLKSKAPTNPDHNAPTPERKRRSSFAVTPPVATEKGPAQAGQRVFRAVSTLDRLLRSGAINQRQHQAGERFRNDWEIGLDGAREATSGSHSTTGWYYADAQLDAVRRLKRAALCLGPTIYVVWFVAVRDETLAHSAKIFSHNRQEAAGILKIGLTALAAHYGLDA